MADSTIATAYIQLTPSTDGLTDSIKEAMGDAGQQGGNAFGSTFGKVMKTVGGASVAAAGAAAAGVAAITKQAVDSYSEYEQLVGGVDTLFGDASATVQENAANAFKTAGMSANAYMESVTSFSASLLQSTAGDTQRAAEIADMAMIDMSDNANKMGTSMESIQTAYQGFAKQNYTMLDNLKLGYGGTKSEMERLLADAQELTGVEYNIDNLSDVYEAIHAIQENIGITGTTSKEASETISGSLSAVQAAWQNVLTGIADENADFDQQIEDLVSTVSAFAGNMVPRIATALGGVADLIGSLVPVLLDQIPTLLETALPALLQSLQGVVTAILGALPDLFGLMSETVLPMITDAAITLVLTLLDGLTGMLPDLIPVAVSAVLTFASAIVGHLTEIIAAAIQVILALVQGLINALPTLLAQAPYIIAQLTSALTVATPQLTLAAVQIILALLEGLIENLPDIMAFAPMLINELFDAFLNTGLPAMLDAGDNLIAGLWDGISGSFSRMIQKIPGLMTQLTNKVKSTFGIHSPSKVFAEIGEYLDEGLAVGIDSGMNEVNRSMSDLTSEVMGYTPTLSTSATLATTTEQNTTTATQGGGSIVIPVYIGQKQIESIVVDALNNSAYLSGGR
jgi:phage-related protein